MKNLVILIFSVLLSTSVFAANNARIIAKSEDKVSNILLNSKNKPTVLGENDSSPTIKDFRENTDYLSFCYSGQIKDVEKILKSLVSAADGDGDSWAELISIRSNTKKEIRVIAKITDEGGENIEYYTFRPCK